MIKTLQKKFIAIAMCSIVIVLTIIIGSINIINYVNVDRAANARLSILADNDGHFPLDTLTGKDHEQKPLPEYDDMEEPPLLEGNTVTEGSGTSRESSPNPLEDSLFQPHMKISAETPFDTRYFTVILSSDGTVISTDTESIAAISADEASGYAVSLFQKGKTEGYLDCYKYCAIPYSGSDGTQATLYIFLDCERELNTFESFLFASIGISLAGLLLVFLLVVFFSRMIVLPVAESYEKQKRFITDASHEIKTPLTIIDANTEVLEMENGENEWTTSIRNQICRLTQLTEKLVFLSRMDEESATLNMLDFSLSDAIEETAHPFAAVATAQQKTLICNIEPNVTYHGDEAMLRQMISLLLDNAMKYSTENGTIKLSFYTSGKNRILTVWNSADGIPSGKLDVLFERFYRPDSSRSQTTGGHGIGLSVVKAIVSAHKGRISAKSADGKSILFTILL